MNIRKRRLRSAISGEHEFLNDINNNGEMYTIAYSPLPFPLLGIPFQSLEFGMATLGFELGQRRLPK